MESLVKSQSSRRVLLGGLAASSLAAVTRAAAEAEPFVLPPATLAVTPFSVRIPQTQLTDLKRRLSETRWPEREPVSDWSQGVPLDRLRSLMTYWEKEYDWRRAERQLNGFPQFRINIDGSASTSFTFVPSMKARCPLFSRTVGRDQSSNFSR